MTKKLISLLLAGVMLLALAACGGGSSASDPKESEQQTPQQSQPAGPEPVGPAQPEGPSPEEEAAREEAERLERERLEQERLEQERLEQERLEAERLEQEKAGRYEEIVKALSDTSGYVSYKEDGEVIARGNAALVLWYGDLVDLGDYKDALALREQFTLLEDVFLYTEELFTDRMGNTRTFGGSTLQYDAAGNITAAEVSHEFSWLFNIFFPYGLEDDQSFTYDENGNVTERRSYSLGGDVRTITSFTYENGVLASAHLTSNMGEYDFTYTCDEQGRMVKREWDNNTGSRHLVATFTYDDAGRVIALHVDEQKLSTPTWPYDTMDWTWVYEGDTLVSRSFRKDTYNGMKLSTTVLQDTVYTCDENGRVLSSLTTYGGSENYTPSYATREVTFRYGDYLVCSPAEES